MAGLLARLLTPAQFLGELHDRGGSRAVVLELIDELVLVGQNALARSAELPDQRLTIGPCAPRCESGQIGARRRGRFEPGAAASAMFEFSSLL